MTDNQLTLAAFEGTARACGAAYGRAFEARLVSFYHQALKVDRRRVAYARRCWRHVVDTAPLSARFMEGIAKGSRLPLDHIVLLSLHEELAHSPHCTAFVASGRSCRVGKTVNAMNWDWTPALYFWPGLLRLSIKGSPRTLSYHYPGFWTAAGLNEHGLSLMWTSTGLSPMIGPRVGLPTYVVIAEILRLRSVEEAVRYVRSVRYTGSFNFLLGDEGGAKAAIEAMPGQLAVEQSERTILRANHYTCADMVRCSKQRLRVNRMASSVARYRRMARLVREREGRIGVSAARKMLSDRHGVWPWIHQFPAGGEEPGMKMMTLDSLIAVSQDRALHTCRGGRVRGPWQVVRV